MLRFASRALLVAAAVVGATCVSAIQPAPASAHAAHGATALDKVAEAIAHPLHAASSLTHAVEGPVSGSLHSAAQRSAAVSAAAGHFAASVRGKLKELRVKGHLAHLKHKYRGSGGEGNDTAEEESGLSAEEEESEEESLYGEEDEFGEAHAPASHSPHAPASSPEAQLHAAVALRTAGGGARAARAHIPSSSSSVANSHGHPLLNHRRTTMPPTDPSLPMLSPVDPVEAHESTAADQPFVLHPIALAPVSPSPSGLNFTTFVYPTAEGNVTIFVGITEYPLGKFHFFPAPRDAEDGSSDISLAERFRREKTRAKAQRAHPHPLSSFVELRARMNPLCDGVATTSVSAQSYGCLLAQNLGFFNMATGACLGNVVSNDQHINTATPDLQIKSHFGLTRAGNFLTGYLTAEQSAQGVDGGFHELAQGNGWLIREGKNFINESAVLEKLGEGFVTEKAPRNAVGHDREGRLLMFEADGEEDIKLGLTLHEFADILSTHFNVANAINVDGGGSSTTVYKGEVADRPTCRDTPQMCERAVTTISCVMP